MTAAPVPFIVLGTIRSGSYNLVSLLDSAPDLVCYGEVYKQRYVELPEPALKTLGLTRMDTGKRDALGGELVGALRDLNPHQSTGFKLFPGHLKGRPFLRKMMFSGRFRMVLLTRPLLEILVSFLIAEKTGKYTSQPEALPEDHQVGVTEEDIVAAEGFIQRHRKICRELRTAAGVEVFDISYKGTQNPDMLQKLLEFLGSDADASNLKTSFSKQSSSELHERVENWEALAALLTRTDRVSYLEAAGYDSSGALIGSECHL